MDRRCWRSGFAIMSGGRIGRRRNRSTFGAFAIAASASLIGCQPDASPPPQPAASTKSVAEIDVQQARSPERPRLESLSPIDLLPEGKRYRRALQAIDNGDFAFAAEQQRDLADHPTYGVLAQAIEAATLARRGKYPAAMRITEQISTVPIMQPESYMIAGDVFRGQGRWRDAIGCLQNAVTQNPGLARAHRWLGVVYYDLGAMQQATDHLRLAADADSSDFGVLRLAARIHSEYQNFPEVVVDVQRALQRDPPEPIATELRLRMADALRQLRRCDEAIAAIADCPDSADLWACRAQCWETAGDSERAMAACEQALLTDPQQRTAHLVLGRLQLAQRDAGSAIQHLQRAVELQPSDHEATYLLGRGLILAGQETQGKQTLERATQLKERFLKIADLHIQAIDHPQDVAIRLQLAKLTSESGRPEIAAMWYRAVLGLDPENSVAKEALEQQPSSGS